MIPGAIRRVPALALDTLVLEQLAPLLADPRSSLPAGWPQIRPALKRVEVHADAIEIVIERTSLARSANASALIPEPGDHDRLRLTLPIRFKLRGGRTWLLPTKGALTMARARLDPTLIKGLRAAHQIARAVGAEPDRLSLRLAARSTKSSYERHLCALAFLAPDIQAAILDGRQPFDVNLERLIKTELPLAWVDQRAQLGFAAA